MSKYIGRKISVGVGKESARGTAVAPSFWLHNMEAKHDDLVEYANVNAGIGTIMESYDAEIVKKMASGGFGGLLTDKGFGLILLSLLGSSSPILVETGVYRHLFSLSESAQHQSLTIGYDEANGDLQFPNAVINSLEINYELGKMIEFSAEFLSKIGASGSLTPSFTAENRFRPHDLTLSYGANLAGLPGTTLQVKTLKIKFEKNLMEDMVLGNVEPRDFLNQSFKISGSFELIFDDTTLKGFHTANTQKALRLKLVNSGVTLGTVNNPTLKIDLAKVSLTKYGRDMKLNDIVMQSFDFEAYYSIADAKFGDIELTNTQASY